MALDQGIARIQWPILGLHEGVYRASLDIPAKLPKIGSRQDSRGDLDLTSCNGVDEDDSALDEQDEQDLAEASPPRNLELH